MCLVSLRIIPKFPKFPTLPNLSFLTFALRSLLFALSPIIPIGPTLPKFFKLTIKIVKTDYAYIFAREVFVVANLTKKSLECLTTLQNPQLKILIMKESLKQPLICCPLLSKRKVVALMMIQRYNNKSLNPNLFNMFYQIN